MIIQFFIKIVQMKDKQRQIAKWAILINCAMVLS